jgi:predicted amidophosphoribosyltransferase
MADASEQDHCGCCGREIPSIPDEDDWCGYCRKHVRTQLTYGHLPAWERTYQAQFGQECPFTP